MMTSVSVHTWVHIAAACVLVVLDYVSETVHMTGLWKLYQISHMHVIQCIFNDISILYSG